MYLLIDAGGSLSLEEVDNMRSFSIVTGLKEMVSPSFEAMSEAVEDNHYWIDAEAVIELSARSKDPEWVAAFWDMLKKSEPYGYSDMKSKRVKAHVAEN
jgi:hypothetical protein